MTADSGRGVVAPGTSSIRLLTSGTFPMPRIPVSWPASIGLLVLRLGMGGYMATHGWGKVQMLQAGDAFGDPIGIGPTASLILITAAEFGCAILIVLGLLTRLAAIPLVFAMGVAAFVAHSSDPWTMGYAAELFSQGKAEHWGSKEPALMYGAAFLALLFTGPGRLSLDALLFSRLSRRKEPSA